MDSFLLAWHHRRSAQLNHAIEFTTFWEKQNGYVFFNLTQGNAMLWGTPCGDEG